MQLDNASGPVFANIQQGLKRPAVRIGRFELI
jgi:hypothetical protein